MQLQIIYFLREEKQLLKFVFWNWPFNAKQTNKTKLFAPDLIFLAQDHKLSAAWNCFWSSALAIPNCEGGLEGGSDTKNAEGTHQTRERDKANFGKKGIAGYKHSTSFLY